MKIISEQQLVDPSPFGQRISFGRQRSDLCLGGPQRLGMLLDADAGCHLLLLQCAFDVDAVDSLGGHQARSVDGRFQPAEGNLPVDGDFAQISPPLG